jgi:hypothetical protein
MDRSNAPAYRNCYAFPALGHAGSREFGLFRLGGSGLSNLLIPWARCLVQARRYGLRRISPTWFQICREQWAQHSPDKRTYHDLFQATPDEISGIERLRLLATSKGAKRVPEDRLGDPIPEGSTVVFQGMEGFLAPILPYRELVSGELLRMVRSRHKRALETGFSPDVAIHVRLGDFGGGNPLSGNTRINLDWYAGILRELTARLGRLSAAVFSDGTDEELASLLEMDGVTRASFGSSIADILGLSQARILITSGSTFSMWASFLGQMPTVWYPGRLPHPLLEDQRSEILTLSELSEEFAGRCEASLQRESRAAAAGAEADGAQAREIAS